jgi:hypothetical protein
MLVTEVAQVEVVFYSQHLDLTPQICKALKWAIILKENLFLNLDPFII